jgi:hypothetical protein
VATVSAAGLVTGVNSGTAQITARVQRSATASDYFIVTFYFTVVSMTFKDGTTTIGSSINLDVSQSPLTITPSISSLPSGTNVPTYTAVSGSPTVVTVAGTTGPFTIKGNTSGQSAQITVTANITNTSGYSYTVKVSGRFTVSVTGQTAYATDFILTLPNSSTEISSITVDNGNPTPTVVNVKTTPSSVTNKTITIRTPAASYNSIVDVAPNSGAGTISFTGKAVGTVAIDIELPSSAVPSAVIIKTLTITVIEPVITDITITGGTTVSSGTTLQLNYVITPSYALSPVSVTWSSNAQNIATVDSDGLVTPVSNGSALITVQITGTSLYNSIMVTVSGFPDTQPGQTN